MPPKRGSTIGTGTRAARVTRARTQKLNSAVQVSLRESAGAYESPKAQMDDVPLNAHPSNDTHDHIHDQHDTKGTRGRTAAGAGRATRGSGRARGSAKTATGRVLKATPSRIDESTPTEFETPVPRREAVQPRPQHHNVKVPDPAPPNKRPARGRHEQASRREEHNHSAHDDAHGSFVSRHATQYAAYEDQDDDPEPEDEEEHEEVDQWEDGGPTTELASSMGSKAIENTDRAATLSMPFERVHTRARHPGLHSSEAFSSKVGSAHAVHTDEYDPEQERRPGNCLHNRSKQVERKAPRKWQGLGIYNSPLFLLVIWPQASGSSLIFRHQSSGFVEEIEAENGVSTHGHDDVHLSKPNPKYDAYRSVRDRDGANPGRELIRLPPPSHIHDGNSRWVESNVNRRHMQRRDTPGLDATPSQCRDPFRLEIVPSRRRSCFFSKQEHTGRNSRTTYSDKDPDLCSSFDIPIVDDCVAVACIVDIAKRADGSFWSALFSTSGGASDADLRDRRSIMAWVEDAGDRDRLRALIGSGHTVRGRLLWDRESSNGTEKRWEGRVNWYVMGGCPGQFE
ncbi:hypothetical protein BJ508DRAFT_312633 [Ascobolus immersus RN42]|uniref:Uncharacterized protein n=1 Tax=Ascobolus immersus RN42 TaxID=1160509 RepID=A0A3N4HRR9_ASCIM|nr:hypothetical protein BJ508DRAFT_312633 [Ascobolus immersus RN42]